METINISRKEHQYYKKWAFTPTQVLALGFAALILLGTFLLTLPIATVDGQGTSFIDALFTSTSATCITGLAVVDTGQYFTVFGQMVILFLVQIGGLGFMSFATLFAIILGKKITLKERILLQEAYNQLNTGGIVQLVKYILYFSFLIEGLGALILAAHWFHDLGWKKAIYFGIFHAVTAFNNAGFDLFGHYQSLCGYVNDGIVNLVIIGLVVLGGLGFTVLAELFLHRGKKLHLHSYLVLKTTAILIMVSTIVIYCLEVGNPQTLQPLDPRSRILASLFQAITPRSVGFSTLPTGDLRDGTLFFMSMLMFIGAAPGSTGGGIKITTFAVILLSLKAALTGKHYLTVRERIIPKSQIEKAYIIAFLALLAIMTVTIILTITEDEEFLPLLFEAVSAFATVGLSTGITPDLTLGGKITLILAMYTGRVGLLTLAFALALGKKGYKPELKYPEEKILIG